MKKRILLFAVLLFASVFAFNGTAHAWGVASGDGSRYTQVQETAVFFNNSGSTLSAGDVVILDTTGTGVASGSTLGAYITTTTSADSVLVVGVVKSRTSIDQTPIVVVTKGPVGAFCQNAAGTAVTVGGLVGTYTTAGSCDGGTNLGIGLALEVVFGAHADGKNSGNLTWIWVKPGGVD